MTAEAGPPDFLDRHPWLYAPLILAVMVSEVLIPLLIIAAMSGFVALLFAIFHLH